MIHQMVVPEVQMKPFFIIIISDGDTKNPEKNDFDFVVFTEKIKKYSMLGKLLTLVHHLNIKLHLCPDREKKSLKFRLCF